MSIEVFRSIHVITVTVTTNIGILVEFFPKTSQSKQST